MALPARTVSRALTRLAAAAAWLALAAPLAAARWTPSPAEQQIVEDASKGRVGAVYLEKTLESENGFYRTTVRAKILSKTGFDVATVEGIAPDAWAIAGRTISPAGAVTELASKDVRTITTVKAAGVSVERKAFTMPALEPGCFVEYTYKQPGDFGAHTSYHVEIPFQDKYPILKQEVWTPRQFTYSSTLRSQNGVHIAMREDGSHYVYSAADMPATHEETYGRPLNERSAVIIFAFVLPGVSGANVEQFWKDATQLALVPAVKSRMVRPGKVADRLKTVAGSREEDAAARLRAIYHYVRKTLKNRSALRAGETPPRGGWKANQDAGDAFAHESGTSSELAAAFASMVRADGWKYRAIWVSDKQSRYFRPGIPSVFQFDGWVVEVSDPRDPQRRVYVSFEHPLLPFGVVPWNHLAVEGLAVDVEGGASEKLLLPMPAAEANLRRRLWTILVEESGDAHVERRSFWTGYQGFQVRSDLFREGRADYEKDLRSQYEKLDPPSSVDSLAFDKEDEPDEPLTSTLKLLSHGIAPPLPGGRIAIAPLPLLRESNPFPVGNRNDPISFPYPYVNQDFLTVVAPEGYVVDGVPVPVERTSPVGRYTLTAEKGAGEKVVIQRTFSLARANAGPEAYEAYRGLFEAAVRADAALSIVFRKAAAAGRPAS